MCFKQVWIQLQSPAQVGDGAAQVSVFPACGGEFQVLLRLPDVRHLWLGRLHRQAGP